MTRAFKTDVIAVFQSGKGRLPSELNDAMLCLETGWSLDQIRRSPAWLINDIILILEGRAERDRLQIARMKADKTRQVKKK